MIALSRASTRETFRVDPTWPEREDPKAAEPVPFWMSSAGSPVGDLRRSKYPPAGDGFFPFKSPFVFGLVPGKARPQACDTGALRVELLRVRHYCGSVTMEITIPSSFLSE